LLRQTHKNYLVAKLQTNVDY